MTPRPRHFFSIWKDTVNGNYRDPHDLPRVVIVVDGPETDCYAALGAVHGKWRPVPGRFKDFIASPKNNLYRSLHTTVLGPEGQTVEVLKAYGGVTTSLEASRLFTNDFVPTGNEFLPPSAEPKKT